MLALMTCNPKFEVLPPQLGQVSELFLGSAAVLDGRWGFDFPCQAHCALPSPAAARLALLAQGPWDAVASGKCAWSVNVGKKERKMRLWTPASQAGWLLAAVASSEMRARASKEDEWLQRAQFPAFTSSCVRTFANVMTFLESQTSQSCLPGNAASFVTPEEKRGFEDVKRLSSFRVNLWEPRITYKPIFLRSLSSFRTVRLFCA